MAMSNIKFLGILLLGIFLLVISQYLFLPDWYRESGIRGTGWLMMLSVAIAIILSIWMVHRVIRKLSRSATPGSRIGSYIGGYGVYPFTLFSGVVIGANFGGAIGDSILGNVGIIVGIGLGIFVVATAGCLLGASFGFMLGNLANKLIKRIS